MESGVGCGRSLLFLTSRNLNVQSGALALIRNRANALEKYYGVGTDFIGLSNRLEKSQVCRLSDDGFSVKRIEVNKKILPSIFFGYLFFLYRSIKALRENERYDAVVLSGFFPVFFVACIKLLTNKKMIFDMHGAFEEQIEYSAGSTLANRLKYMMLTYNFKALSLFLDASFVVSSAMGEYLQERVFREKKIVPFIVPCTTVDDSTQVLRSEAKAFLQEKFEINPEELVFIYTGNAAPWQCLHETLELFSAVYSHCKGVGDGISVRLLLLISNEDFELHIKHQSLPIIVTRVEPHEVRWFVAASDWAFLIRRKDMTNHVAFPNKFMDYIVSGTPVIATDSIKDVAQYIRDNDLGLILKDIYDTEGIISGFKKEVNMKDGRVEDLLHRVSFSTTLKHFVEWL